MIEVEQTCPEFNFESTSVDFTSLNQLSGKNIVFYFYPRDNTPGCTQETEEFRDSYTDFKALNCEVVGISRDTLKSHDKFKDKLSLPFELVADPSEEICHLFSTIKDKNMFGKKVKGIERSTFIIDMNGTIRHIWRKVKVDGHVGEVLAKVKEIA